MKKKVFSLMMTLLLAFMGVAKAEVVTIGDGTGTTYYAPYNSLWGYSFVEQVYTASEIGTAGTITAISFNLRETDAAQTNAVDVFMKNVSRTAFSDNTDWEPVTASDMVFSGTVTFSPGWTTITLDTPFEYDGTSNLMIGMHEYTSGYSTRYFYYTSVTGGLISGHSDTYNPDPYNMGSFSGTTYVQNYRANIQIDITPGEGGDEPEVEPGLHTLATYGMGEDAEELIDILKIDRPNGAWMEPYHFQLYNDGEEDVEVVLIDFLHNNGYFSMDEETEYPFTVAATGLNGAVDLYINTNIEWEDTEEINSLLAVNTSERSTHLYEIVAAPYAPYCPDVVEKAYPLGTIETGTTWSMFTSEMWAEENPNVEYDLHDNYTLPFPEIPEGYDAVIKITADHDILLNASVTEGENGKVALYRQDFAGRPGPMADNNYTGRPFHNMPSGVTGGELTVHNGTETNGYVPVYGYYADAYLKCEMVYLASELSEMNGFNINSMKFYLSSPAAASWGNANFQVFLTEVSGTSVNSFNGPGTIVYEGPLDGTQPEMTVEFTTPYHYNGGNLLVGVYNTAMGSYKSCSFYGETISGASYQGYSYSGLSYVTGYQRNFLPKTTFAYGSRVNQNLDEEEETETFSAGPVIENLNVLAGTYYLVASSTDEDFEVTINAEELPCPIEAVTNIYPEDNAFDIPSNDLTLRWTLNDYANEWRLVFSSTYYPEDEIPTEHPATYVTEWSSDLAEEFHITNYVQLWDNTNYFWRIEQRSNPDTEYECVTSGPVFGFTTSFDVPQNLQVNGGATVNIFETEEDVTLTWDRIYDRTYRRYRVYWNGELYYETTDNDVEETSLTIPNSEFHYNMVPRTPEEFNVTAVYDEGESPYSNTVYVQVSGYGTVSGTAYEQDGVTPIGGVTVVITGTNEFGDPEEYTYTTDENGYYEGEVHVGEYSDAMAYMNGYQSIQTIHPLPFNVVYQEETPNVDFIIDETFYYPAHVCARPVYVPTAEGDTLVQVWWEGWASDDSPFVPGGAFEAQIGDGTSTLTYAPFHTLWNYSLSETLYRADELTEAGVTGAAMTSLSYFVASTTCTTPQNGISIWMANVSEDELTGTSHTTAGMTLVYTGSNVLPVAGQWNEFVFNQGNFSWDGESNILIVCQRLNGDWQGSVSWQTHNPGFTATTYDYDDYTAYNCQTTSYSMYTSSSNRPNIIMKAGSREVVIDETRALHHFNIYRTDCYNDGPYNSENTEFLASVWRPDTSYFDVQWPEVPVGVYKYGVSAVYQGNQADNPNNPRVDYPFEERESEIMWSDACGPCIDKDMQTDITVNVVCNSADSPEGCVVSFTNLNEGEQFNHPQPSITLDATGYQVINPFRKGDYLVTVYLPGYELLQVQESIWGHRDLRYVLTEIIYNVKNLYVSRTGWAMWDPETWEDYPIPSGAIVGPGLIDFETGDFSQYGFDNTIGNYHWSVVQEGQDGGYCMKSGNAGVASSSSIIEATVNYTMDGIITFDLWSRGEGSSDSYDWDKSRFYIDGVRKFDFGAHSGWESYTADVAAGEHTFRWEYKKDGSVNPTGDCFLVDNINFNIGGSRSGDRHLEGYKIMCTSLDDEPIFNHNTPVDQPFCQLSTVDPWSGQPMLIEGERYKVKVATIYSTGQSDWCEPVIWQYEPCDHWGPVDEVTAGTNSQGNHIEWVFEHGHNQWFDPNDPGQGGEADTFSYDFENVSGGNIADWTTFQGTNGTSTNGWMTYDQHNYTYTNMGHNGSAGWVYSESYITGPNTAVYPDNYLVSPQVNIGSASVLNFWVTDANDSYGAEHFAVEVSTASNNTASDFTPVFETTLLSKGTRSGRDLVNDQVWYNYSVNLGAYAGQQVYIAFHHFNCYDQWFLALDDVELTTAAKSGDLGMYHSQEIYRQYAEDGVWMNFLGISNVDFRAYLLYSITKDNRFSLTAENSYGQFVVNAAYDMDNFMGEFESFYEQASYDFSLLSKMDIYEKMNEWKNGVSSQDFLSITMDVAMSNARVENDQCINSLPFCTSDLVEFEAASTNNTANEENMDDGCIYYSYNPSFYHMRIHDAGPFVIHMEAIPVNPSDNMDVDFCIWGPYTEQEVTSGYACTHLTSDKIMDCCYSASETEDVYLGYPEGQHQHNTSHGSINYHMPQVGEYYILMLTNYSRNPCTISFTKTEGEGETDCDIVTPSNIIGFLITQDGEYLDIVGPDVREYTDIDEFGEHEYCVRPIYPGPAILSDTNYYFSMGCPVCATPNGEIIETCDAGAPVYAEVNDADDQVHIYWGEQPTPPEPTEPFYESFESGDFETTGWTAVRNGGGNEYTDWRVINGETAFSSGPMPAHDGTYQAMSRSWSSSAYNVDNWLISPQVSLFGALTYWVMDDGQYHEHYDVYVSTTTTDISAFTLVYAPGNATNEWTEHTVDLSDYAGQMGYIAFRNIDYDQDYLFIDDITIGNRSANRDGIVSYNIYRSTDNVDYALIANVPGDVTEYFDAPGAGTYYYQVTAVYADGCESEPAVSGTNPDQNYVMVGVTGIGENVDNVNLFPNPTKGNVTIQAMNMHRITVVSVLGQVVYDTEVDQDEVILNMSQFNTGMYMVRVYTDNGVTVKRVTVMH